MRILGVPDPHREEIETLIPTGFASQPGEFAERSLNLHDLVVNHPLSTFFLRVDDSNDPAIANGTILIVDRAQNISEGALVVYVDDDHLAVRACHDSMLVAIDPRLAPIPLAQAQVYGVVTWKLSPTTHQ